MVPTRSGRRSDLPVWAVVVALGLALLLGAGVGYLAAGYQTADELSACRRVASHEPSDGSLPPPADEDVRECLGSD